MSKKESQNTSVLPVTVTGPTNRTPISYAAAARIGVNAPVHQMAQQARQTQQPQLLLKTSGKALESRDQSKLYESHDGSQKESLFAFLCREYPKQDLKQDGQFVESELISYLRKCDSEKKLNTWHDFAEAVSAFEEMGEEDSGMNVCKSSTWAVCQELLGHLQGQDLWYSRQRGGFWSFDHIDARIVTTREILERLKKEYPTNLAVKPSVKPSVKLAAKLTA